MFADDAVYVLEMTRAALSMYYFKHENKIRNLTITSVCEPFKRGLDWHLLQSISTLAREHKSCVMVMY